MKIVVIGAGVVGISVAVELAKRGAEVTVVERNSPGSGTSSTSYAWVNSNNKDPVSYYELNKAGLEAHHRLAGQGDWLQPTGHVEFAIDENHRRELAERVARLREHGYAVELISVERAQELVPELLVPDSCDSAVFFPEEACAYPSLYLAHMMGEAERFGVRIISGLAVDAFDAESVEGQAQRIHVILSDGSAIVANRVVSAAGRWTNTIARLVGFPGPMVDYQMPGDVTVGYLAVTNPLPVSLNRLVTSPWLNVRPAGGGRLLLQALDVDSTADPYDVPSTDSVVAREFITRLQAVFANTRGAEVRELQVGQRAMPRDGLSVIGAPASVPWLYIVATHSGVTLAPVLGTGVAGEIFGDVEPLFAEFRPDRFLTQIGSEGPRSPRRPGEQ